MATQTKKEAKALQHDTSKIIDSIAALPQADRVKLYRELAPAINGDSDKLSQNLDNGREAYDNLIMTYENNVEQETVSSTGKTK